MCPEDFDSQWEVAENGEYRINPKLVVECAKGTQLWISLNIYSLMILIKQVFACDLNIIIILGCVDDVIGYKGYACSTYQQYCKDSNIGDWYNKFRAACKSTCSRYASSYCNAVTCKG